MRILGLEPYFGGSHRAFLDGWSRCSRHDWTVLELPAYKWKWRMRHAAHTFAEQVAERLAGGERFDLLFCSDMLNLAEFYGLAPASLREIPSIAYFHENQLTYPVRCESERDYHFGYTNMTTALAASRVWFNSAFNRDSFLEALPGFLARMPDYQPLEAVDRIRAKSDVQPPGITFPLARSGRASGPLRILWAARWEHDKNPAAFFEAMQHLKNDGVDFQLLVIGEQFRNIPDVFAAAKIAFAERIVRWGHQPGRADYESALLDADVIVSTADHEFFGLSVVEAIAAGAYPLLPNRLAYPELLSDCTPAWRNRFLYDGKVEQLARRLRELAEYAARDDLWGGDPQIGVRAMRRFDWSSRAAELDQDLAAHM